MRTEDQLRTALARLRRPAHATDDLYDTIIRRTQRQPVQRRRMALVLAVAAVLIAVAIAVPTFLVNRTGVPADQRVRGNWNQIHRVDLPAGWQVSDHHGDRRFRILRSGSADGVARRPDRRMRHHRLRPRGRRSGGGRREADPGRGQRTSGNLQPARIRHQRRRCLAVCRRLLGAGVVRTTGSRVWTSRSGCDSRSRPRACPSNSGHFRTGTRYEGSTHQCLTRMFRSSAPWTRPQSTSERICPTSESSSPPGPRRSPNTSPGGRPTQSPGCRPCSAPATLDCA